LDSLFFGEIGRGGNRVGSSGGSLGEESSGGRQSLGFFVFWGNRKRREGTNGVWLRDY
jgi:hypothetical protein